MTHSEKRLYLIKEFLAEQTAENGICLWRWDIATLKFVAMINEAERYENFIHTYSNESVLYLGLGVGYNTPGIIKYPFWQVTAKNPEAI